MRIKEIDAKSVLVRSKLPDVDYVVNPYTGCQFGCAYCYASFMGRFVNENIDAWGNYLCVKTNAIPVFTREIRRLSASRRNVAILLSSVTDPYQGIENKFRLTRGILEILADEEFKGLVSILTKSPLVIRDLDVLKRLPQLEVGLTVTTTDDRLGRLLEVHAPIASRRLETLRRLNDEGIRTYAFVGPLLPHFRYRPDLLEDLFAQLAQAGVRSIYVEHMNLKPYVKQRLWQTLSSQPEEVQQVYKDVSTTTHRAMLDVIVLQLVKKYKIRLRHQKVLYHNDNTTYKEAHGL